MNELDSVILSYHDSLILDSDLELLKEGNWFNDRLIGFVYEYFENEIFKGECNDKNMFAFLNPSTVQYLKLCESIDEARMCFLDPLELKKKRFIFLPLNNNKNLEAGGDHWSLLVIDRNDSLMKHYDSIGSNKNDALYFFEKYKQYFEIDKFDNETKFPKQKNSSDCGAYLLGNLSYNYNI